MNSISVDDSALAPNRAVIMPVWVVGPNPGWLWYETPIQALFTGCQLTPSAIDIVVPDASVSVLPSSTSPVADTRSSVPRAERARRVSRLDRTTLNAPP